MLSKKTLASSCRTDSALEVSGGLPAEVDNTLQVLHRELGRFEQRVRSCVTLSAHI